MTCNKCNNYSCNGKCRSSISRQVRLENNSLGRDGTDGINSTKINIYSRSANKPSLPNVPIEYNFLTGVLTNLSSQWKPQEIPDNGLPLWISTVNVRSRFDTITIFPNNWSDPAILVISGKDGVGIVIKGNLDSYQELLDIVNPELGDSYSVKSDNPDNPVLLYTYGENGWPDEGEGVPIRGQDGDTYIPETTNNFFDL